MKVSLRPGKYVLAVSGGVDSMVLLDLLSNLPGVEIIVAHFDHGIRPDSAKDEEFVENAASRYGLVYETKKANLGPAVSEEKARDARYEFLENIKTKHKADAVVTAHHQDDLIETALINILRGTGPRGLVAIASNAGIKRPFLNTPKREILNYARKNSIKWREDPTNIDTDYLRNYLRINILPRLDREQREMLISNIDKLSAVSKEKDAVLAHVYGLVSQDDKIDRQLFSLLPSESANELVVFWLRQRGFREIDRKMIGRLSNVIKTALPGTRHDVAQGLSLAVNKGKAWLQ